MISIAEPLWSRWQRAAELSRSHRHQACLTTDVLDKRGLPQQCLAMRGEVSAVQYALRERAYRVGGLVVRRQAQFFQPVPAVQRQDRTELSGWGERPVKTQPAFSAPDAI